MTDTTTIEIREDQADDLHDLKERGDSYKDVLDRLLAAEGRVDPDPEPEPTDVTDDVTEDVTEDVDDDETAREELAEAVDLPGPADRQDDALDAIEAARALIEETGAATKKEIVREVMPEHPVGYDVEGALIQVDDAEDRYRGSWWRRVVKPGLEESEDVRPPRKGAAQWTIKNKK